MLRIIGGQYKKMKINILPGNSTRPTQDRVRENIFNILQNKIEKTVVIDLFSGTGALGLEALSRGAQYCTFLEKNKTAAQLIRDNCQKIGIHTSHYQVICDSVENFLKNSTSTFQNFHADLVFADPPYQSTWYEHSLQSLQESQRCRKNCTVVIEMPCYTEVQAPNEYWEKLSRRKYGKTCVEFWEFHLQ